MHAAQNRFPTIIGKEWNVMYKRTIFQKLVVMGAALLLATSVFAAKHFCCTQQRNIVEKLLIANEPA